MVFPVSKHTSICGSLSEHLNRESSNILILAPTCLHPDHTNTVTTQAREGQHREASLSLPFPFTSLFSPLTHPSALCPSVPFMCHWIEDRWLSSHVSLNLIATLCSFIGPFIAFIEREEKATPVRVRITGPSVVLATTHWVDIKCDRLNGLQQQDSFKGFKEPQLASNVTRSISRLSVKVRMSVLSLWALT